MHRKEQLILKGGGAGAEGGGVRDVMWRRDRKCTGAVQVHAEFRESTES